MIKITHEKRQETTPQSAYVGVCVYVLFINKKSLRKKEQKKKNEEKETGRLGSHSLFIVVDHVY